MTRIPPRPTAPAITEQALRRELYFFTLYRALEAGLLALVMFSPFGDLFVDPRFPMPVSYTHLTLPTTERV